MLHKKIDVPTDAGLTTLCDEELDVVSAGATFTVSVTSNQIGNANSTGNVTVTLNQGVTGQTSTVSGVFATT